jgi:hypothetical protein
VTLEEALETRGLADPRPLYRDMLRTLRQADAASYEEAVRRYEQELAPASDSEGERALDAWIDYGRWLAGRLTPGRVVAVDRSGQAENLPGDEAPSGALILYLPDKNNRRALALAVPSSPSPPQEAARELLVG